ncbi:hypothetical protein ACMX8W_11185 [Bacillus subtilis]|uniref:hypothetical protein n=1 Tax=Bacillus TaxID=1386 RepID=UPI000FFE2AAA|nr:MULTISPECIES: hypothetical protein [Bacillus]NMJ92997.1 hypothetical protein [Bacillus sp. WR12]NUC10253.1 hypothetical protein [Bacillus subtilis]QAT75062.1 hypothetical protein D9C22_11095 [Bacillus sp. WR11]
MAFHKEVVKTIYKTVVICDKCGKEKVLNIGNPLSWEGHMNGALHYDYTFKEILTEKGNGFATLCPDCQKEGVE